jgi:ligand-binding SRPBCC domain-containing protein
VVLNIQTVINAPIERCFDLARSIDFHVRSASSTAEKAIAGGTSGLISQGQEVEWQARHFGLWLRMRVRITEFRAPFFFQDSMTRGPFRSFIHDHHFEPAGSGTLMTDRIMFSSPAPVLGFLLDHLVIRRHLEHFIQDRNLQLKAAAESDIWRHYLLTQNQ